eukprot:5118742-Amphidinium_carterae.1
MNSKKMVGEQKLALLGRRFMSMCLSPCNELWSDTPFWVDEEELQIANASFAHIEAKLVQICLMVCGGKLVCCRLRLDGPLTKSSLACGYSRSEARTNSGALSR